MKPIISLSLLAAALLPVTAFADSITWDNPTSGSWFVPGNWSTSAVPTNTDIAFIDAGISVVDGPMARANSLVVSDSGALTINEDSSLLSTYFFIHDSALPGYSVTVSGYSIDDDIGLQAPSFFVGINGIGKLLINGNGAVYANGGIGSPETWTTIGGAPDAGGSPFGPGPGTGEVTVTGSHAYFGARQILIVGGHQGTGTLNVLAGATAEVSEGSSILFVAAGAGTEAVGNVTVSGEGSNLHANVIALADNLVSGATSAGTATLTVDDGGLVSTKLVYLGPGDTITDTTSAGHIYLNGVGESVGTLFVELQITSTRGTIAFDGGMLKFGSSGENMEGFSVGDVTLGTNGGRLDTNGFDVTVNAPLSSSGALHKLGAGTLTLGVTNYFTGGVVVQAGTLAAGVDSALPSAGPYVVNGGTLDLGGHLLHVSSLSGTGGTIDIDGNLIVEQDSTDTSFEGQIASDGPAVFIKSGSKELALAGGMPSGGNIDISAQGGSLVFNGTSNVNGMHVGNGGTTGAVTIASGSLTASQYLTVGEDTGSTGTLTIGNGGTLTLGTGAALTVGYSSGTGTLNIQPGGTLAVGGNDGLATSGALSSTINFGGTIKVVNSTLITSVPMTLTSATATVDTNGQAAIFFGALTGTSGGLVKVGAGVLSLTRANTYTNGGAFDPATVVKYGGLFVDGGSITHPAAATYIGHLLDDNGTMEIFNGGTVSNAYAYIGYEAGSVGHVNLSDSGSSWTSANSLAVGYGGSGTLLVANGSHVTTNGAYIGYDSGSTGYATVTGSGSQWANTGAFQVGSTGTGTLTIAAGGVVVVNGGAGTVNVGTGTINIGDYSTPTTGGTLSAAAVVFGTGSGAIYFNQTDSTTYSGTISGPGSVLQRGSGTTTLTGANTYSGSTVVSAGKLLVNGSLTSTVDVQSGGTLGGVGQFGNITLESGGMFAPGNSIGTVEASVFIWNGGGRFVFELGATTNDLLNVVALLKGSGSSFTFDFVNAGWQVGHTYTLIDFDVSGFAASDFGYSNGGDFNGIFAYNGSALTFQLVAIPEPSSCALVFAGFLTVLVVIRRRGAHSN